MLFQQAHTLLLEISVGEIPFMEQPTVLGSIFYQTDKYITTPAAGCFHMQMSYVPLGIVQQQLVFGWSHDHTRLSVFQLTDKTKE